MRFNRRMASMSKARRKVLNVFRKRGLQPGEDPPNVRFHDETLPSTSTAGSANECWQLIQKRTWRTFCRTHGPGRIQQANGASCVCTAQARYVSRWVCIDCFRRDYEAAQIRLAKFACGDAQRGIVCESASDVNFRQCLWCRLQRTGWRAEW